MTGDDLRAKRMKDRIRAWKRLGEHSADASLAGELAGGLADSHVQIRLAACRAVPAFAAHAGHLVPLLIRRRFEPDARVRQAAAVALAWVLPHAAGPECWAYRLTARRVHPGRVMRELCDAMAWPPAVEEALRAACERRQNWHRKNAGRPAAAAPFPTLWHAARAAARSAARRGWPDRTNRFAQLAEFAWQLALGWELCQNALPQ